MKEKINRLIGSIEKNESIDEKVKYNIAVLVNDFVRNLPDYDYTDFENVLSTLKITNSSEINDYGAYQKDSNTILFNTDKILEDRIDTEHLFLQKLLLAGTNKEDNNSLKSFNDGMSEAITLLVVGDDGFRKNNVLEYLTVSLLSKVVDPKVLIDSFMKSDVSIILDNLGSYGIDEEEFRMLMHDFANMSNESIENNQSFANAQRRICTMYGNKISTEIETKNLSKEDINQAFFDFSESMVYSKPELISVYPGHNFSNISGLEYNKGLIKETLSDVFTKFDEKEAIVNKQI